MPFTNLSALLIQSGSYVLLASDDVVDFGISSAATATLPSAASVPTGKRFTIKNINSSTDQVTIATTSGQTIDGRASSSILLSANDFVQVVSDGSNWKTVVLQETIAAVYFNTAGTTVNNTLANLPYATKIFDTHNAYSAGIFTAPATGKYAYDANAWSVTTMNSSTSWYLQGYKQGSTLYGQDNKAGTGAPNTGNAVRVTGIVDLVAGETFQIKANLDTATSVNLVGTSGANVFSIQKIGN